MQLPSVPYGISWWRARIRIQVPGPIIWNNSNWICNFGLNQLPCFMIGTATCFQDNSGSTNSRWVKRHDMIMHFYFYGINRLGIYYKPKNRQDKCCENLLHNFLLSLNWNTIYSRKCFQRMEVSFNSTLVSVICLVYSVRGVPCEDTALHMPFLFIHTS